MNRRWAVLLVLFALGCPPPSYVDILNNTGTLLTIHTPDGLKALFPGESAKLEWHDLFSRWEDLDADGTRWPILEIDIAGRKARYRYSPLTDPEWVHAYGSIVTAFVQVEPDFTVRISKPSDQRPVPIENAQPVGWPLKPLASADSPSNNALNADVGTARLNRVW